MAPDSLTGRSGLLAVALAAALACGPSPETAGSLLPVPTPDLAATEPVVREQLETERRELGRALEATPRESEQLGAAFGRMGKLYHAYDLLEPAEACYRNAERLLPGTSEWNYLLGLLLERRGRLEEAADAFEAVLREQPDNAAALLHLGQSRLAGNHLMQAQANFSAALAAEPTCQAARFGLGEVSQRQGDLKSAAEHFLRVLEEQPTAEQVHYPLAQVLLRLGRSAEAQNHLRASDRRALSVGGRPQCPDPLDLELAQLRTGAAAAVRRGLLLGLAGNAAQELELLRRAIEQSPRDPVLRRRLGTLLLETGDLEEALAQLTAALRLAPEDSEAHMALGVAAGRQGDFETAENHFRAALRINPASVHYRMQLGGALQQLGRCDEAVELFTSVLESEPVHRQALLQRSACRASLGEPKAAARDMARLLDAHPPDDPGERLRLASMLLSLGEDDEALRHFQIIADSSARAPIRAAAHLLIGQVELRRDQRAGAEESFRRALELDPRLADRLPGGANPR